MPPNYYNLTQWIIVSQKLPFILTKKCRTTGNVIIDIRLIEEILESQHYCGRKCHTTKSILNTIALTGCQYCDQQAKQQISPSG